MILAIAGMIALLFYPFTQGIKKVKLSDLETQISSQLKKQKLQKKSADDLRLHLHISNEEYDDFLYYGTSSFMDVNEVIIVYSPSHVTDILSKMNTHLEQQNKAFDGYGESQMELLKKAKIFNLDDYAIYIVSDTQELYESILAYVRK